MMSVMRGSARGSLGPRLLLGAAVVLAYAGLAVFLLDPLFSDPQRSVLAPGPLARPDVNLIMWVMAWDWHALTRAPGMLFDANIFYPAPNALACSEHMLGHVPIFGPVYALTGNPVLANQVNLLTAFATSGAAMYALLRHWGVERSAAFFGGFVYAFAPVRTHDPVHVHLLAMQYLPLALLFLDRTLVTASPWDALGLAVSTLLQALCSYYLAYMVVVAIGGYAIGVLIAKRGQLRARGVLLVLAAGLVAGVVFAMLSRPYLQLQRVGVVPDYEASLSIALASSGFWKNFLYPPVALRAWGYQLEQGFPLYVGVIPLVLAVLAFARRPDHLTPRVRWARAGALGLTAACYLMTLGPTTRLGGYDVPLPYAAAARFVPGFSAMRVPGRFGLALMAGVAALAALGLASVLPMGRAGNGRRSWLGPLALVLFMAGTAYEYDLLVRRLAVRPVSVGEALPPVYRALASAAPGPVLEIPMARPRTDLRAMGRESEYMLYSTFHWHPLLNGYSGYRPLTFAPVLALVADLPGVRATELLTRTTGLRYVIVHLSSLPAADRSKWLDPPGLRLVDRYGWDLLFEVPDPPPADLLPAFIDVGERATSVLGTPLAPVPESERRVELVLEAPSKSRVRGGGTIDVAVEVTNRSGVVWPALSSTGDHLVTLAARWLDETGAILQESLAVGRLPYDLEPQESARAAATIAVPVLRGKATASRLVVGVAQDGQWFDDPLPPILIYVTS
jgi:hypothetical protein